MNIAEFYAHASLLNQSIQSDVQLPFPIQLIRSR